MRVFLGTLVVFLVLVPLRAAAQETPQEPTQEAPPQQPPFDFTDVERRSAAGESLLDIVIAAVKEKDRPGVYANRLWQETHTSLLASGWIVQTPNVWGKRAGEVGPDHSRAAVARLGQLIESAQVSVDIATLDSAPNGAWLDAINAALEKLARSRRQVTVRILVGDYGLTPFSPETYLRALRSKVVGIAHQRLTIYVAAQRTGVISWNHAKIVSIDGRTALVGGHNFWTGDYLRERPVHDLSMVISGGAASSASLFLNELWKDVCAQNRGNHRTHSFGWSYRAPDVVQRACVETLRLTVVRPGKLRVFGVGRAGTMLSGGEEIQPSDTAIVAALGAARVSIRIAQQDLPYRVLCERRIPPLYWWNVINALGRVLKRGVQVDIVLSSTGAKAGPDNTGYSSCEPNSAVRETILKAVSDAGGDPATARLRIESIRFGPDNTWTNDVPIANHSKMFIVDDKLFYIGAHNLYPANLQEYGYFVEDAAAAKTLLDNYWNKLWLFSSRTATGN